MSHYDKCWRVVDEGLAKGNAKLDYAVSVSDGEPAVVVRTVPLKGRRAPLLLATYCPFCGEKL